MFVYKVLHVLQIYSSKARGEEKWSYGDFNRVCGEEGFAEYTVVLAPGTEKEFRGMFKHQDNK